MKKLLSFIAPTVVAAALGACVSNTEKPVAEIYWSAVNLGQDSAGVAHYIQSFRITGLPDSTARIAFNMFARQMQPVDPQDTIVELVPGYYAIGSPRLKNIAYGDTVTIDIMTRGTLRSICYSPDGVHAVGSHGQTIPVKFTRFDLLTDSVALAAVPSHEEIFLRNEALSSDTAGVYDIIPSFKNVRLTGGSTSVDFSAVRFSELPAGDNPEACFITIADGTVSVRADSSIWARTGMRLRHYFGDSIRTLPCAEIQDYPDLHYRGLMIDVARNFQPAAEIHRILDLMAIYGLNTFHFHLTDDEAWRLEIDGLPELTSIGSRRGYIPENTSADFLPQIFAGNGNPDETSGTANGHYTKADMIAILRHADSLAINVIPEIESPGHARAAIIAMRRRPEYRLDEVNDTSRYTSAQAFHDNVMNPALPGTYRFMETVIDRLADMYAEAGVPLRAIHIGGDEVPRNAWSGSPAVAEMMRQKHLSDEKAVHAYFVSRIADYIASKGIAVSGWQEIALRHPGEYNDFMRPKVFSVNCWSTLPAQGQGGVITDINRDGFPIVLSNVDHFYLDMCYSPHPDERGLSWGGYVDEFDALAGYAGRLAPGIRPVGIQCQIFAETIRSEAGLETMLLPKMPGVAERAWNTDSTYSEARFNAVINKEIPAWQSADLSYHVRQPGIHVNGRRFEVNSSYTDAIIRWTSDGSDPTAESPEIKPGESLEISPSNHPVQIRVRQWVGSVASVATVTEIY